MPKNIDIKITYIYGSIILGNSVVSDTSSGCFKNRMVWLRFRLFYYMFFMYVFI